MMPLGDLQKVHQIGTRRASQIDKMTAVVLICRKQAMQWLQCLF